MNYILDTYNSESVEEMNDVLKNLFRLFLIEAIELMNNHIGYESNDKGVKYTDNRRNGYTKEIIKIS